MKRENMGESERSSNWDIRIGLFGSFRALLLLKTILRLFMC